MTRRGAGARDTVCTSATRSCLKGATRSEGQDGGLCVAYSPGARHVTTYCTCVCVPRAHVARSSLCSPTSVLALHGEARERETGILTTLASSCLQIVRTVGGWGL